MDVGRAGRGGQSRSDPQIEKAARHFPPRTAPTVPPMDAEMPRADGALPTDAKPVRRELFQEDYAKDLLEGPIEYRRPLHEFFRVPLRSPLGDLLYAYYEQIGVVPHLFNPETETEAARISRETDTTKTRTYLYAGRNPATNAVELEVHRETIGRAFYHQGVRTYAQRDAAARGKSDPEPLASTVDALLAARLRFPDVDLVYAHSPGVRGALRQNDLRAADLRLEPTRVAAEAYLQGDDALAEPANCEAVHLHRVWVDPNNRRHAGFPGGFSPLGVCGRGVAFGVGSVRGGEHALFVLNAMGTDRPVARLVKDADQTVKPTDEALAPGGGAAAGPAVVITIDLASVYPVWRQVRALPVPAEVLRCAVSAQRAHGAPAVAACMGRTEAPDGPLGLFVYLAQPGRTSDAVARRDLVALVDPAPPTGPVLPTLLAVSDRRVLLVVTQATAGGQPLPPHMYVREFLFQPDAASGRAAVGWRGDWEPFLIEMPPRSATDPPPKFYEDRLAEGTLTCITAAAFDAFDADALLLGTYDGLLLPYRLVSPPPGSSGRVDCRRVDATPFLAPNYATELAIMQEHIRAAGGRLSREQERALLDSVGAFRSPILSIHASWGTHGGDPEVHWSRPCADRDARSAFRIACGHASGVIWQMGDADTVDRLARMRIAPSGARAGAPVRCVYSFGRLVAINDFATNFVHLLHTSNNAPVGSVGLETKRPAAAGGAAAGPGQVFQSLWMDVGRIVLLYPDGDVMIVVRATDEALAERARVERARAEAIRRRKEQQIKDIEETSAKLAAVSLNQRGGADAAAAAPNGAPVGMEGVANC